MRRLSYWTLAISCWVAMVAVPALASTKVNTISIGGICRPGGTIKGMVKFSGKQKKQGKQRVGADPFCARAHKDAPLLKEKFVFGKNGTLQNVFVYVSKGLEGQSFEPPDEPAVIDQNGCQYVPHVSGVVVKQAVEIRSSDNTTHNVKVDSKKNGKANNAMGPKSGPLSKQFKKAEMAISLKCNVHTWMNAYIHVMKHPFFAVTQGDGTFEIKGLPPGEYQVSVWHELSAFKPDEPTATVTVSEGETAELTFTYAPKKRKKKS